MNPIEAAIYARVSSEKQANAQTIESQIARPATTPHRRRGTAAGQFAVELARPERTGSSWAARNCRTCCRAPGGYLFCWSEHRKSRRDPRI